MNEDQLIEAAEHEMDLYRAQLADATAKSDRLEGQNEDLREQLGRLQDSIGNLAAGLKLSADASRPSKKSQIEDGVHAALLGILDPR